jgi:hypothetical protein
VVADHRAMRGSVCWRVWDAGDGADRKIRGEKISGKFCSTF